MINLFWRLVAKLLAHPAIAAWLIARAKRTPYLHIMSADGAEMYMGRWWLFNPYSRETHKPALWWFPWSFRIHHIMRPDEDRDLQTIRGTPGRSSCAASTRNSGAISGKSADTLTLNTGANPATPPA